MGNCFGSSDKFVSPANTSLVLSTEKAISSTSTTGRLSTLSSTIFEQSSGSGVSIDEAFPVSRNLEVPNLRIYTLAELKSATKNFKPETFLGEGGFGKVFKGWVDEKTLTPAKGELGMLVAVKKFKSERMHMHGLEQWQFEVNFMGRISHPNIVKLLGYSREDRELHLVYEFMPKGSLDNQLFRRGPAFEPLSWIIRLKIAIGAARGLAFLHSSEKNIMHCDFKSFSILLDSNFNAKISDFALAKNGPKGSDSPVMSTIMAGTFGYMAPEYLATGHLYVKSDVFGFGVVLLEILSGQRAIDPLRPTGQRYLVDWAKPFLADKKLLGRLIDPGLEGQYSSKGAAQAAQLTLECLAGEPRSRPSMKEVVVILEEIEAFSHHKARGHNKAPVHPWSPLNARHEGTGAHAVYQSSKARCLP